MDAGNGAQKAGDILIKSLAKQGCYVFIEPIIPAEISPPKRTSYSMSGVVIRTSDAPVTCIGSQSDLMIVEHEILLKRRLEDKEFASHSTVLIDMTDEPKAKDDYQSIMQEARNQSLTVIPIHLTEIAKQNIKLMSGNGRNMFYLGLLSNLYNVPADLLHSIIRQTFRKLSDDKLHLNIEIFNEGAIVANSISLDRLELKGVPKDNQQMLLDGNTAMALGLIDSGIRYFSGYPITPASSIMHTLAKVFPNYGGILHQAEDEIAAIGAAIGSYYGGTPSATATSGPGFSLKQEFIGFAMAAEIPLIVINVQRGGPSTGLPTRTEQSDLFAAAFGSHGDSTKIVLSVSNVQDCFYAPHVARYLTEMLKLPVIIMSDYQTSVSYKVFDRIQSYEIQDAHSIPESILNRFGLSKISEAIQYVKSNQSLPGEPEKMRRITGLNTSEDGKVAYSSESSQRAHEIRNEKMALVRRVYSSVNCIGSESADICIIGWGSSEGTIIEVVEHFKSKDISVAGICLKIVVPLPENITEILSKYQKVVTVETAYGDDANWTPFATLLRAETLLPIEHCVSGATGRPLNPMDIIKQVSQLTEGVAI